MRFWNPGREPDPAIDDHPSTTSVVRAVYCQDAYTEWCRETGSDAEGMVSVQLFWRRLPLQRDAVQAIVRATAASVIQRLDQWHLDPMRPWLSAARSLAGAGLLPIPQDYEPPAHLRDFRRLLPDHRFRIKAGVDANAQATDQDTFTLERLLQWACDLLEADAMLFLPSRNATQPVAHNDTGFCEPEIVAPPLRGQPHPLSESEQKLAKAIAADSFLAPLFAFNAPVRLDPLCQPCVDVLWEAGKLVIEVDDPSHWHKVKYAADRQRDFELMASGYLVLRITAEEVLKDMAKALCKIKTCVALRRQT